MKCSEAEISSMPTPSGPERKHVAPKSRWQKTRVLEEWGRVRESEGAGAHSHDPSMASGGIAHWNAGDTSPKGLTPEFAREGEGEGGRGKEGEERGREGGEGRGVEEGAGRGRKQRRVECNAALRICLLPCPAPTPPAHSDHPSRDREADWCRSGPRDSRAHHQAQAACVPATSSPVPDQRDDGDLMRMPAVC